MKWKDGKRAAASLTYDDSTINQFRVALPIMNQLNLPGTFYVITGAIPGSQYEPTFVGRPVDEIIAETADIPTNKENLFERASAIRFLGLDGTYQYHNRAGQAMESGNLEEAISAIDEGYQRVRNGEFVPDTTYDEELYDVLAIEDMNVDLITWDELQEVANQGHEIGSHTILHPYLAVLDSANIHHELVKSREDILNHLGPEHTFSAEGPFGTENERVMEYAYELYPALRNRMPHSWLDELNRSSDEDPTQSQNEYVQWQRGTLSDTPMETMKSWVDTSLEKDNIWLVLVIHGVEGIGWEPLTESELTEYFGYMADKTDDLWVATFKDVTQYIRERMNADVETNYDNDRISVNLTHSLDPHLYNHPLTLKTYIPTEWSSISVRQGDAMNEAEVMKDDTGTYVLYDAVPNAETIELSPENVD
ncbi:polysaccharide deacetylase family protein [Rhodohalobacter sp. 614A]|uniref:polysaccharide deacetylase family protein n=1 Tax=Rhodohalobacter sp. 614A TaxID=2908649 RepID=UPI001F30EDC9|nr:polysaccharide deacetylase family protein [Rhodohalobacter sp. 614A]